ncbi:hypothetical protein H2248_008189 [Termitomyces sp. 'cryptogamus']|nr:hypothetical protein H2248_008189 [Termitomyces sp. 'cryptogamus']
MLHSLIPSKDVPSVFPSPVVWLSTQYNKSQYHLKDVTVGQFYFLLVQQRSNTWNSLSSAAKRSVHLQINVANPKFEIMNGDPVCGETIPIHLLLGGFDLTPTFRDVNKKFSTEYYRNLVLIDEEDRRYFKQQIKSFSSRFRLRTPLRSRLIYTLRQIQELVRKNLVRKGDGYALSIDASCLSFSMIWFLKLAVGAGWIFSAQSAHCITNQTAIFSQSSEYPGPSTNFVGISGQGVMLLISPSSLLYVNLVAKYRRGR